MQYSASQMRDADMDLTGGGARPTRLQTAGAFYVGNAVPNALRTGRDSKWDPDLPVTVFNEAFLIQLN